MGEVNIPVVGVVRVYRAVATLLIFAGYLSRIHKSLRDLARDHPISNRASKSSILQRFGKKIIDMLKCSLQ